MKKIITLLIGLSASLSLFAYYGQSKLSITSTGNAAIRVMVDGNKYRAGNNTVLIGSINDGYHDIKVFQLKSTRNGRDTRGGFGGSNISYTYQLVYSSRIFLKPQYFTDIVINRFGKAFIDEQLIGPYNEDDDDWGDYNNNPRNNPSNDPYYNEAMGAQSFDLFKQSLKKESFDDTRASIAKQVISTNYFTSAQVKEIVDQFSFDNTKLEIAKFAYKYTIDKGSYFLVNDAFSFKTSKDDLMKYIRDYK